MRSVLLMVFILNGLNGFCQVQGQDTVGQLLNTEIPESSGSRFVTKDQLWKDQMGAMLPGLLSAFANKKNGNINHADMPSMGFKSKEEFEKQMAFAEQSEDCLKKLSKTNSNSYVPVRYVGDSSELLIHIDGSKVQLYTPNGMVEIDGTKCKAFDSKKNVVDGLIKIADKSVQINKRKGISESEAHKAEQSKRVIGMLQSCGQVDSKFEEYAKKTLKESYNIEFKLESSMPNSSSNKLRVQ